MKENSVLYVVPEGILFTLILCMCVLGIVMAPFVVLNLQRMLSQTKNDDEQPVVPSSQSNNSNKGNANRRRLICLAYAITFFGLAIFASSQLPEEWWSTIVIILLGMISFGALLEAMKKNPLN